MFGCLGRLVVLAVLVVVGGIAFLTRGMWEPRARATLGLRPAVTAAAPAWEPITAAGAERVAFTPADRKLAVARDCEDGLHF